MRSLRKLALNSGAEPGEAEPGWELQHREGVWIGRFSAMASPCEVHVAGVEEAGARATLAAVAGEAARIERKFSRYRPAGAVHEINSAAGRPVRVDAETARLLDYADRLYSLSQGRFDITSGVLRQAWRFDGGDGVPEAAAIAAVLQRVGWQRVRWENPIITLEPGMEIDLGGIAKEYAVDRAATLIASGIGRALINFGGDLLAIGASAEQEGWRVGIEALDAPDRAAGVLRLARGALATSGDTRRFVLRAGKRYGHILDPRTGWPVTDAPRSVTVAAPTCTEAGMLATFAMLQGAQAEEFLAAQGEAIRYWCLR
jgi:thiamine biosynthesis lipoprotein